MKIFFVMFFFINVFAPIDAEIINNSCLTLVIYEPQLPDEIVSLQKRIHEQMRELKELLEKWKIQVRFEFVVFYSMARIAGIKSKYLNKNELLHRKIEIINLQGSNEIVDFYFLPSEKPAIERIVYECEMMQLNSINAIHQIFLDLSLFKIGCLQLNHQKAVAKILKLEELARKMAKIIDDLLLSNCILLELAQSLN